jgi:hypothetical protein
VSQPGIHDRPDQHAVEHLTNNARESAILFSGESLIESPDSKSKGRSWPVAVRLASRNRQQACNLPRLAGGAERLISSGS